jgi:hypothetical protein
MRYSTKRSVPTTVSLVGVLGAVLGAAHATAAHSQTTTPRVVDVEREAVEVKAPSGVAIADVVANGSGCPAGTWATDNSDDGTTFTMTFDAYEARVEPGSALSVKDCQLAIQLRNVQGVSYAVESL